MESSHWRIILRQSGKDLSGLGHTTGEYSVGIDVPSPLSGSLPDEEISNLYPQSHTHTQREEGLMPFKAKELALRSL